ncbi:hypothetical protein ABFV51_27960, partial [Pseudomonas asgharzadehiana]|uniref:hypothetical protein n=1 Tax=Pseudomonas asgharzadehiana TaxID=2842349 RepID=UPI0034D548BA
MYSDPAHSRSKYTQESKYEDMDVFEVLPIQDPKYTTEDVSESFYKHLSEVHEIVRRTVRERIY